MRRLRQISREIEARLSYALVKFRKYFMSFSGAAGTENTG
jgi:hypothetical protein